MKKKIIIAVFIVSVLTIIGVVAYLRHQISQQSSANNVQVITSTTTQVQYSTSTFSITTDSHRGVKFYRNEEFGFEFWYPEGWWTEENRSINPFIKLEVNVYPGHQGTYTNFKPFRVLISTMEHAQRVKNSIKSKGTPIQAIIDERNVIGYDYFGPADYMDYIIIFDDHGVFIGNENKEHIPEFNQILASFKFLK